MYFAAASAREPAVSVGLASLPTPAAQPSVDANDARFWAFRLPPDLWKKDLLKREPAPDMNANAILLERSAFQNQVRRFGDPHAPAAPELKIEGLGICLGGYAANGAAGFRTC
jgi:hypothetical protein